MIVIIIVIVLVVPSLILPGISLSKVGLGELVSPVTYTCHVQPQNVRQKGKGNSHQIFLSEMSLPGIEGLIEKLLPKRSREIGEGEPL